MEDDRRGLDRDVLDAGTSFWYVDRRFQAINFKHLTLEMRIIPNVGEICRKELFEGKLLFLENIGERAAWREEGSSESAL